MDYKEKYEQALERARQFMETPYLENSDDVVGFIFPELKESEDEKIRKALLEMVHDTTGDELWIDYNVHKEEALAWLEKQANHANFCNKIQIGDKVTRNEDGILVNLSQLNRVAKPADKQCEQKPIDKVEPKFHEGEWITNGDYTWKIVEVKPLDYILQSQDGNIVDDTISHVDEQFHSFTIKDAKDGDVLSFNDGHGNDSIELIKSITDKKIEFWFCLTNGNRYEVFDGIIPYTNLVSREGATPATKEQRDLLFQKMKEAGYEWNAENKELKKIEQKPAYTKEYDFHGIKFIPKFAKGDIIKDKKCGEVSTIEDFSYDIGLYTHTYGQFPITIQDNYEIIAQKPAWSKEDETMIALLHNIISHQYSMDIIKKEEQLKLEDWLKSLRPQNTWKPSDEQMITLRQVISGCSYDIEPLVEIEEYLKKLKE